MSIRIALALTIVGAWASACAGEGSEGWEPGSFGESTHKLSTSNDSLIDYAIACEAATGIRVPAFDCNKGVDIPQGTGVSSLPDDSASYRLVGTSIGVPAGSVTGTVLNGFANETIVAGGADISGTSDQFVFANVLSQLGGGQGVAGDGYVDVYISELGNTHAWAKAGIMFRDGTSANARNVMVAITPSSGVTLQRRETAGANTKPPETVTGWTAPVWLRLARKGNTFTGFVTKDRVLWKQVGLPTTINNFPTRALVGLAVTSHNTAQKTTAKSVNFSLTGFGQATCDRPSIVGGCDPGTRVQVLAQTPDAAAVALCRKDVDENESKYDDIAVIQYNKHNGAVCFYQSPFVTMVGTRVPAPALPVPGDATITWSTPQETREGVNCVRCHDNGGFLRSPFLTQLEKLPPPSVAFTLPSTSAGFGNLTSPLRFVGHNYVNDRTWSITEAPLPENAGAACNSCHQVAANNLSGGGTARAFGPMSTEMTQGGKNPHGPTSPIWTRPTQVSYEPETQETAEKFQFCGEKVEVGQAKTPEPTDGCSFTKLGQRWDYTDRSFSDWEIGGSGTANHTGSSSWISSGGGDISGSSDKFMYSQTFIPSGEDGYATVKVSEFFGDGLNALAKGGIMLRTGLHAEEPNAMIAVTSSGVRFQYRQESRGGTTITSPVTSLKTLPLWLRLTRTGATITAHASGDQVKWEQIGPAVTIPSLRQANMIGHAVSSNHSHDVAVGLFEHFSWTPASPATLSDSNIGVAAGSRKQFGKTNTITAGGSGIGGTSDQFHYSFKTLTGDGEIISRVTSLENTSSSARAGLMIRSTSSTNSPNVMLGVAPSSRVVFQRRIGTGRSTDTTTFTGRAVPIWLKLRRAGDVFTGSTSTDGVSFTDIASIAIGGFGSTALVGLAVTSANTSKQTTAVFTGVAPCLLPNDDGSCGTPVACTSPIHTTWADTLHTPGAPPDDGAHDSDWTLAHGNSSTVPASNPDRSRLMLTYDDVVKKRAPVDGSFYISHELELEGATVFTPYPHTSGVLLPSIRRSGDDMQLGGARYGVGVPWSDSEPTGFAGRRMLGTLKAVVTTYVKAQDKRIAMKVEADGVVHRSGWTAQLTDPITDMSKFSFIGENNSKGTPSDGGNNAVFVGPLGGCAGLSDAEVEALYNK